MRLILTLLMLVVVATGVAFSVFNAIAVPIEFHFFRIEVPLGLALLAALLLGWLLGGLTAWFGARARQRRSVRRRNGQDAGSAAKVGVP